MSEHERIAPLLAWYVNGTLAAQQRGVVERHLERCPRCRALVDQDREMIRGAPAGPTAAALEHVHAALLTRYVEEPEALDRETREWIEERVAACTTCSAALDNLRQVEDALRGGEQAARPSSTALARLWDALAASVLRPVPALAYLLLLVAVAPTLWLATRERHPASPGPIAAPRVHVLAGARATRDPGGAAGQAVELSIGAARAPLLLELETELGPDDLVGPGSFLVELVRDGRKLWSTEVWSDVFVLRGGAVVLPLLLDPGSVETGAVHEVRVVWVRAGDPLDGQALFRRTVRFVAEPAGR